MKLGNFSCHCLGNKMRRRNMCKTSTQYAFSNTKEITISQTWYPCVLRTLSLLLLFIHSCTNIFIIAFCLLRLMNGEDSVGSVTTQAGWHILFLDDIISVVLRNRYINALQLSESELSHKIIWEIQKHSRICQSSKVNGIPYCTPKFYVTGFWS